MQAIYPNKAPVPSQVEETGEICMVSREGTKNEEDAEGRASQKAAFYQ